MCRRTEVLTTIVVVKLKNIDYNILLRMFLNGLEIYDLSTCKK